MPKKQDERRKDMTQGSTRFQVILATLGVAMALLLAALDQTVVGVAMPRIVSDLHGIELYAWVTTAYLITSTALVPVAGKLGDMFGRKPFMLAGMVGFIAASALCGVSQNMIELVLFRAIQGIFGGVLFASTFAVMTDIFPPEQRARMSGVFGAIFGLSSVIGPSLGGFLTDGPGWRWVFYVNIPLGVVATILVATQLPRVRSQARLRDIDFVGTALLLAGLTPLLISLSMLRDHSWLSVQVLGLLGLAAVLLVAFFITERRVELRPAVDADAARGRGHRDFDRCSTRPRPALQVRRHRRARGDDPRVGLAGSDWPALESVGSRPRHHHHRSRAGRDLPAHARRGPGRPAAPAGWRCHEPDHVLEKPRRHDRYGRARGGPHQPPLESTHPARAGRHIARPLPAGRAGRGGGARRQRLPARGAADERVAD